MKFSVISAAIATALYTVPSTAIIDTFLWPIPQSLSWGEGKLDIDHSFKFEAPAVPELQAATDRYRKFICKERWTSHVAKTPVKIEDAPSFPHRGIMVDTARNYYTVDDILRTIDGMAYNKMNVFHWHITDSQIFPLLLESVPDLGRKGAYTLHGKILGYSKKDVKRIVKYGRERGVRIVPELDMPAHTGSWKGVEVITYANEPTAGQLNPINPKTYQVVTKVINEVTSWFTDEYYHAGGDEPVNKCWEDDKGVSDYMKKHNVTGDDLLQTFLTKELGMIKKHKKTAILWEDAVTNLHLDIPKETVLQFWTDSVKDALNAGHRVIASNVNFFYFDSRGGNWNGNDTAVDEQVPPSIPKKLQDYIQNNFLEWAGNLIQSQNVGGTAGDWCVRPSKHGRVYRYDPTYGLNKNEAKSVFGGEVALWSEQNAAELLWSGRYDKTRKQRDIGEAMPRMLDWRYRLVKRGIKTEAIQPLWCAKNSHFCDSKYPWVFTHPNDGNGY
ncbi:hypothetical protein Unana1_03961 [Umbelopsis nana]